MNLVAGETVEIRSLIESASEVFGIPEGIVDAKARIKLNSVPMVMEEPKRRIRTSKKIEKSKKRMESLETELAIVQAKNSSNDDAEKADGTDSIIIDITDIFKDLAETTSLEENGNKIHNEKEVSEEKKKDILPKKDNTVISRE